jgi:hypothetical protein
MFKNSWEGGILNESTNPNQINLRIGGAIYLLVA